MLHVTLFGDLRVERDGCVLTQRMTRAAQMLFAYLLLRRNAAASREQVATVFWGEHSDAKAKGCLNTALWRLRQALEADAMHDSYLQTQIPGMIGFNWHCEHWLDTAVFEDAIQSFMAKPLGDLAGADVDRLADALALGSADYLPNIHSEWIDAERERLATLRLNAMTRLLAYRVQADQIEASLALGEQILRLDPLREDVHRDMMRAYHALGQRALALRQFDQCRDVLRDELGVDPMRETFDLRTQLTGDAPPAAPQTPPTAAEDPLQSKLQTLYEVAAQAALSMQTLQVLLQEMLRGSGRVK